MKSKFKLKYCATCGHPFKRAGNESQKQYNEKQRCTNKLCETNKHTSVNVMGSKFLSSDVQVGVVKATGIFAKYLEKQHGKAKTDKNLAYKIYSKKTTASF